jgi:hypothetical protein
MRPACGRQRKPTARGIAGERDRRVVTRSAGQCRDGEVECIRQLRLGSQGVIERERRDLGTCGDLAYEADVGRRVADNVATAVTVSATRRAYDADTYQMLQAVKAKHDPHNVFRATHNNPPAPAPAT